MPQQGRIVGIDVSKLKAEACIRSLQQRLSEPSTSVTWGVVRMLPVGTSTARVRLSSRLLALAISFENDR